jgi:hypothetical protein
MKKSPALLDNPGAVKTYTIKLLLQENKTAVFHYSDRNMAQAHWDQIRAHNVVGNHAVKRSEFIES